MVKPYVVSPITSTLYLDHCWVCHVQRDGFTTFEEHHVVPCHLGGTNGPVVSLCDGCHTKVHDSATKLYRGVVNLPYREEDRRARCLYLAQVICRAQSALESQGNLNKKFKYSDTFSYEEHELLVSLQRYYGKKSQGELVRYALQMLAKQTF